jgi:hypothetical protein
MYQLSSMVNIPENPDTTTCSSASAHRNCLPSRFTVCM